MIYVIGSINIDLVMKTDRMPRKGETLMGDTFLINHGGKGANQAVAVSKSNAPVTMIGAVGEDGFGKEVKASLAAYGVHVEHVHHISGHTGVASIWLTDQDNRIIIESGANAKVNETMINQGLSLAKPNDILLLQLEIPMNMVLYALKVAKDKQMQTCLNPAPYQELTQEMIDLTDILCVNEVEFSALEQQNLRLKNQTIIQTLGKRGVKVTTQQHQIHIDGYNVNVVDTTAAGDTFIGAYMANFERSKNIIAAAHYANAAAALSVTRLGAQQSIPSYEETTRFMEGYHD